MADSKLRDLSTDFAVKVIKLCNSLKGHYHCNTQCRNIIFEKPKHHIAIGDASFDKQPNL